MEAIVERCAGLDVHQASVVACLNVGSVGQRSRKEVRTFGTTRAELTEMRDWLTAAGCTLVAMESTGVYWMPVYAVLEGHFELVVGNAQHIGPALGLDPRECAGAQDRRKGLRLDQRSGPPWADCQELRATASDP